MYGEPIGQTLSDARHRLGKSIKEVEFDTKIRAKYLDALERDDFDNLPTSIYTQGFIKTYANYLGLDSAPLVQQYKGLYAYKESDNLESLHSNIRIKTKKRSVWSIIAIAVGVIALLFIGIMSWGAWQQYKSRDRKISVQEQDIKTRKTTPTTVAGTTITNANITNKKPDQASISSEDNTTGSVDVKIIGKGDAGSWTKVSVDGEKSFEGMIHKGETKEFKGDSSVRVRTGNITNVDIIYNGKKLQRTDYKTANGIFDKTFTPADKTISTGKTSTSKATAEKSSSQARSTTTTKTTSETGAASSGQR